MKYKSFLSKVAKLTDVNNHTEARIEIAKQFNLVKQLGELKSIRSITDRQGHIEYEQIQERTAITNQMLTIIENTFDKKTRDEINSKL